MDVIVLASGTNEADEMRFRAEEMGHRVLGKTLWNGPVPAGSYMESEDGLRMSTPEFMFLRKASELPFQDAVALGMELCGKYSTRLTDYMLGPDEYEYIREPRTSKKSIKAYLRQIDGTKAGKRAMKVLKHVKNGSGSPMDTYLYMVLCLPRKRGGAGLPKPDISTAYMTDGGFMPSAHGSYVAYDLCWRDAGIAVQYVGKKQLGNDEAAQLTCGKTAVLCVTDGFDPNDVASEVASALGCDFGPFEPFADQPTYAGMRMTFSEIRSHMQ